MGKKEEDEDEGVLERCRCCVMRMVAVCSRRTIIPCCGIFFLGFYFGGDSFLFLRGLNGERGNTLKRTEGWMYQ